MTTTLSQTVFSPWLTPVRLVSTANIAGTYYNGPNNNGVGATFTIAASSLTIDSVLCAVGDRVLLQTQTTTYQQGIYIVQSIGSTVVLARAEDQQDIEQLKAGEYVSVGAGALQAGNIFTLIEPLPQNIGVDPFIFSEAPVTGNAVTFSGGASAANALAVFSDTAGNIKAQTTVATLGFGLTLQTGDLTLTTGDIFATAGNVSAGSNGNAGAFASYPATLNNGAFVFSALNAGGVYTTTLRNSAMGQSSTISIPDPGASTANILLDKSAAGQSVAGGFTLSTGNLAVSAGTITSSGAIQATAGNITAGSSTHAAGFISFPASAANGTFIFAAANAGGAFNTTISNATSVGQNQVISVPDSGTATAKFLLDTGTGATATITKISTGATPVPLVDPANSTITAAAGAANTATVTIQLKDGAGTNIARKVAFKVYASSAADGLTLAGAASTGFSVASGGLSLNNGAAITTQISAITSASGACVLSLLDTGKQTSYLVLVTEGGTKTSAQLSAGSYG